MGNVSAAVNHLEEKIRSTRQNLRKEIEAKRSTLCQLQQKINDFQALMATRSDLENAAELRSLAAKATTSISTALGNSRNLDTRLKRTHLNIVVAGAARQGKSQMLRMLSGVDGTLIPTGDTTFCTAAQSRITNDSSGKISVHFLSKEDFMRKKVFLYYEDGQNKENLGLSPKPHDLRDFIAGELPKMSETFDAEKLKYYQNLQEMHATLKKYAERLLPCLNGEEREVSPAELKPYITKDDPTAVPLYLAVDHVEIHTKFPNGLTEGTMLIDLPGVSEMAPNIRENMKNTIREEADIVLMMKLPSSTGDAWNNYDYQLFRMMGEIFPAPIGYRDWLAVIVNEKTSGNGENTKQVEALIQTGQNDDTLPQLIRCDCGSPETVDDMLDKNLDTLLKKTQELDDAWCKRFLKDYETALSEAKKLYSGLCRESGHIVAGFDYRSHEEDFLAALRGPVQGELKNFYESLRQRLEECSQKQLEKIFNTIGDKYNEISNGKAGKEDEVFPIFTQKRLEKLFTGDLSWDRVIETAGRQQQWAIITLIRHYFKDVLCGEITRIYLSELLKKLDEKKAMSKICGTDVTAVGEDPVQQFRFLQGKLASQMKEGEVKNLDAALEMLLDLEISAEGNVLPYFVHSSYFRQFERSSDPEAAQGVNILFQFAKMYRDEQRYEDFSKVVFEKLQNLTENVFKDLKERGDIKGNLCSILVANAKMFILQFYFSETVEKEWRTLVRSLAPEIWPEEYALAASKSELGKQWQNLLREIQTIIQ